MLHHIIGSACAAIMGTAVAADVADIEKAGVWFSPQGGALDAVIETVENARETIDLEAFHFSNKRLAKALVRAKDRGVRVRVVLDKENRGKANSKAGLVSNAGIPVRIDARPRTAHNKVILIDHKTVVTGSLNFNGHADRENAENTLILTSGKLTELYRRDFEKHWGHSDDFRGETERTDNRR